MSSGAVNVRAASPCKGVGGPTAEGPGAFRAGGLRRDLNPLDGFLGSLGRRTEFVACQLLRLDVALLPLGEVLLFAPDDKLTRRAGPKVEGAGFYHNPTPGPAGLKLLYGHAWVTLAWVVRHPLRGEPSSAAAELLPWRTWEERQPVAQREKTGGRVLVFRCARVRFKASS